MRLPRRSWSSLVLVLTLAATPITALLQSQEQDTAQQPETGQRPDAGLTDPHRRRSTIYVAVRGAAEVVAYGRDSGEELARIPVGRLPSGLAARPDGDRIYVACAGAHTVQVIDGANRTVLDTVALPHGAAPSHLVLSPDGRTLYVAATGLDSVYVFDAPSLQQTAEIPVGRAPTRLAIDGDGRRLFALATEGGRVDIIETAGAKVVASVPVGSRPADLAFDPRSGAVYVVRPGAPILSVLPDAAARVKEIALDVPAAALTLDLAPGRLVTASPDLGRIAILVAGTGTTTKVIRVPAVSRVALDPEGKRLYALSARRGLLLYVNRVLGGVERELKVGKDPWDLVLIP